MDYYAHTPGACGEWQKLEDHLLSVAENAREFAAAFGGAELAYLAGLWHDVGKFHTGFQDYLKVSYEAELKGHKSPPRGPDHSSAGAVLATAVNLLGLAAIIAGHHSGLPSLETLTARIREKSADPGIQRALQVAGSKLDLVGRRTLAGSTRIPEVLGDRSGPRAEMFLRFLFSAVVDADRLDTERHFDPSISALRSSWPTLEELWERYSDAHRRLSARVSPTEVNVVRREVYEACLRAAEWSPGLFRLTVPTGGGKTLSSLAFALRHALIHGLRRIIVAIPYTSITEQTARVLREVLGSDAVLEHHSSVHTSEEDGMHSAAVRARLAEENWDAPVVVTTTVQLLESLFSDRPGRCRKLHRIARSVVVLDEVQALPVELLVPVLDVIRDLSEVYGSSIVLCTATQPAFDSDQIPGLRGIREIVPNFREHFRRLKRVQYSWDLPKVTWEQLAREIRPLSQVLVIVNTRKDAHALLDELADQEDVFHLSTSLCPAHRQDVLNEIRVRLDRGLRCRVVSTQVVEAGVDLDFPVVMRAVGPLESIVQAAGRCNREGGPDVGRVIVFEPLEGSLPKGVYRTAVAEALKLLRRGIDLHDPTVFETYFRSLYSAVDADAFRIQDARKRLDYPEVARRFRMIPEETVPVVVHYRQRESTIAELLNRARRVGLSRGLMRDLQPFMVSLYNYEFLRAQGKGLIGEVVGGLYEWRGGYDDLRGAVSLGFDPGWLVV